LDGPSYHPGELLFVDILPGGRQFGPRSERLTPYTEAHQKLAEGIWFLVATILSDDEVLEIETYEPVDVWEHRARLVVLLVLQGLNVKLEILRLVVSDVNFTLGTASLEGRLVPLSPLVLNAIRDWLECRPQRGNVQKLITADNGRPAYYESTGTGLAIGEEVAKFLRYLNINANVNDLHATCAYRLIRDKPDISMEHLEAMTGRKISWAYIRRRVNAERSNS